jgi:hypothetical protein
MALGPGAVAVHLYQGNTIQAFFWALPVVAIILAFLFPGAGPGHFALTHEFGPVPAEDETERQYHLKMAKWWFCSSLVLPVAISLAYAFEKYEGFVVATLFAGFLLGVPCFLKGIGSLFNAARSKS